MKTIVLLVAAIVAVGILAIALVSLNATPPLPTNQTVQLPTDQTVQQTVIATNDQTTNGQPTHSGLRGTVFREFCPGMVQDPATYSCTKSGLNSLVIVRTTGSSPRELDRANTGEDGSFSFNLPAGTYSVEAVPTNPCSQALKYDNVKVLDGQYSTLSIRCSEAAP